MTQQLPDLSMMSSISLEKESIDINGQKLLFDKKVKLMPVEIEERPNEDE